MRNWLVRPPFSENPPITLRFDASSVGLLFAVWSLLALIQQSVALGETASALSAFSWQALSSATGAPLLCSDAGFVVEAVLSLVGGLLMFRRRLGGARP
jgi:hypothetical protein